jgi:beta-carotene 3-hydroxylase
MLFIFYALVIVAAFVTMEGVAWSMHKYVMHKWLWVLHEDHHNSHDHPLEKNDLFAAVFAIPGWLFIMFGVMDGCDYKLYIGIGVTLYGICYFLIHDGLIHQRINVFRNTTNIWFIALRKAHKAHHKKLNKEDGECFGMLLVPMKYFREARKLQQHLRK